MKFEIGKFYNWKNQKERLVYLGKKGIWHQFALVSAPENIWCEVITEDLYMLEETEMSKSTDNLPDVLYNKNGDAFHLIKPKIPDADNWVRVYPHEMYESLFIAGHLKPLKKEPK